MNWTTAWEIAGEICDLLHAAGTPTTAAQHEAIATIIQKRDGQKFNDHRQEWVYENGKAAARKSAFTSPAHRFAHAAAVLGVPEGGSAELSAILAELERME